MNSPLQDHLLRLAQHGPVSHSLALEFVGGVKPRPNTRGKITFDSRDPQVHAARVTLSRSLSRLEARGLIERRRHAYRLVTTEGSVA